MALIAIEIRIGRITLHGYIRVPGTATQVVLTTIIFHRSLTQYGIGALVGTRLTVWSTRGYGSALTCVSTDIKYLTCWTLHRLLTGVQGHVTDVVILAVKGVRDKSARGSTGFQGTKRQCLNYSNLSPSLENLNKLKIISMTSLKYIRH